MNTMKWLVRREIWEHKGAVLWAPVITGLVTMALLVLGMIMTGSGDGSMVISGTNIGNLSQVLDAKQQALLVAGLSHGYLGLGMPIFIALAFVVFFFSLSTLADERKDRSVLFWKSMPVSDGQTVASKAFLALVLAPTIAVLAAIVAAFAGLLVVLTFGALHGMNLFGEVFSSAAVYTAPLHLLSVIPVYALWALPAVGWLMLVGAAAPRKAFLWAILLPVMAGVIVSWMSMTVGINDGWFWENISGRLIFSVVPGSWLSGNGLGGVAEMSDVGSAILSYQSWAMLGSIKLWMGAIAGVGMLIIAARVRRWKDEG